MGLSTDVLMLSHYVPGWNSVQPQTNREVTCNTVGGGVVYTSHMTAVLIKGQNLDKFIHRESTMNDTVTKPRIY